MQAFQQFTWNKFSEMSHKFCASGLNFSSGAFSDQEQARFKTCLDKYGQAFNLFKEEQALHFAEIARLEKMGGDKFAKFNEYDRF